MTTSDDATGLLRSAVRRDIVDTLANLPQDRRETGLSAREIGAQVGLHASTVRFHLDQLVAAGLLRSHFERSHGAGRPSKKYAVAQGSLEDANDSEHYATLAGLLAEMFSERGPDDVPLTPEQAGAAWAHRHAPELVGVPATTEPARTAGAWLGKVGVMIDVLRDWGYTPNLRTEDFGRSADVDLVGCPFLPLARSNPEVVCAVHRGLMRGTLEVFGEADVELSLTPFVEPHRCLAHLTTRTPFAPTRGARS